MNVSLPFNLSVNLSQPVLLIFSTNTTTNGCNPIDWLGHICQTDMYIVMVLIATVFICVVSSIWTLGLYVQRRNWRPFWHWKHQDLDKKKHMVGAHTLKRLEEKGQAEYYLIDLKKPLLECQECGRICNLSPKTFPEWDKTLFHFCKSERKVIIERECFNMPGLPICPCQMSNARGHPMIRPSDLARDLKDDSDSDSDEEQDEDAQSTMLPMHWEQMLQIRVDQLVGATHIQWDELTEEKLKSPEVAPGKLNIISAVLAIVGAAFNAWAIVQAWADLGSNNELTADVTEHWAFLAKCQIWFEFILVVLASAVLLYSLGRHAYLFRSTGLLCPFLTLLAFLVDAATYLKINSMDFLPTFCTMTFFSSLVGLNPRWSKYHPLRLVDKWSKLADKVLFWGSRFLKVSLMLIALAAFVLKVYRLAVSDFVKPISTWRISVWNMLIQFLLNTKSLMDGAADRDSPIGLLRGAVHIKTPFYYMLKTADFCQRGSRSPLCIFYVMVLWLTLPPTNLYFLFVWNAWYRALDTVPSGFTSPEEYYEYLEAGKFGGVKVNVAIDELKKFMEKFPSFAEHRRRKNEARQIFAPCVKRIPNLGVVQNAAVELQRDTKQVVNTYFDHLKRLGGTGDLLLRDCIQKAFIKKILEKRKESIEEGAAFRLSRKAIREAIEECLDDPEEAGAFVGYSVDKDENRLVGLDEECQFFCEHNDCGEETELPTAPQKRRRSQFQPIAEAIAAITTALTGPAEEKKKNKQQCEECMKLQTRHGALKNIISLIDLRSSVDKWIEELPEYGRPEDLLDEDKIVGTFKSMMGKIFKDGATSVTYEHFVDEFGQKLYWFQRHENAEGYPVVWGDDNKLHCGRITEDLSRNLDDLDGRCGPDDGAQCQHCEAKNDSAGRLTRAMLANGFLLVLGFYAEGDADKELSREWVESAFYWWLREGNRNQDDPKEDDENPHNLEMHTFILDHRPHYCAVCELCLELAEYRCVCGCDFYLCNDCRFSSDSFYHMDGDAPFFPRRYDADGHFHCEGMTGLHPKRDTILRCRPNLKCKDCPNCKWEDGTPYLCDNCQCPACYWSEEKEENALAKFREAVKVVEEGVENVKQGVVDIPPKKQPQKKKDDDDDDNYKKDELKTDYLDVDTITPNPTPTPEFNIIVI